MTTTLPAAWKHRHARPAEPVDRVEDMLAALVEQSAPLRDRRSTPRVRLQLTHSLQRDHAGHRRHSVRTPPGHTPPAPTCHRPHHDGPTIYFQRAPAAHSPVDQRRESAPSAVTASSQTRRTSRHTAPTGPPAAAPAFPVHTPERVDIREHRRGPAPRLRLGLVYPHGPLAERTDDIAREREKQQQILDEHIPRWRIRFALALGLFPILWILPRCGECKKRWPCPKLIGCLRNKHGWTGSIMPHVKQLATKRRRAKAQARNPTATSHRASRRSSTRSGRAASR